MDGVHDMGGMDNFGRIEREANEPVFHGDWERAVFANFIAIVGAGYFKVDEIRRTTELIPAGEYLNMRYYERWFSTLQNLLIEKGALTAEETAQGRSLGDNPTVRPAISPDIAQAIMTQPVSARQSVALEPRFKPGDPVRTKVMAPLHHTRIPRYVRGRCGVIEQDHGVFLLPDTNAHGGPDTPEHTYSVRFPARELWGEDAPASDALYIDLFESYLEPAAV